ncbi:MAG: glucose-6-phosphate dehydrogenase assembly protein OpcA [Polyangiaceae bacterium]|nr:glucose-6-phosphate dehydrogenase assembly protein OpcA [Polyangiaceae bacterium]
MDTGKLSDALSQLERSLAALWAPEAGQPPKSRVCTGNLVLLTGAERRASAQAMLDELRASERMRTFLVSIDPRLPPWSLEAGVSARCQREGEQLLCSERIELSLGAGAIDRVPSVVSSLWVPEVPTTFVLLEPAPALLVSALTRDASRLILDSEALGVEVSATIAASTHAHLIDLAWMRLYPWRNAVAGAFDTPALRAAVSAIHRLAVRCTGPAPCAPAARLLVGWLASRLRWSLQGTTAASDAQHQHVALQLEAQAVDGVPAGKLLSVELGATFGEAHLLLDVERSPHTTTLQVTRSAEGHGASVRRITLPEPSLHELLDRAIDDPTPDTALRQTLQRATLLTPQGAP